MLKTLPTLAATLTLIGNAALAETACTVGGFDVTDKINGFPPPAQATGLKDTVIMMDRLLPSGERIVVARGTRPAGTRAPIHVHKYGGHTCVLSGAITDFVEGLAPSLFPADSCYYMPANTPMTAANLGSEDAVLIDTFILPPGEDTITVIEFCP